MCLSDRHLQFILHVVSPSAPPVEIAFLDARRLGRIRLCKTPLTEPPISKLGFDPILSMPDLEQFKKGLLKRSCPVKALLLDQSFSAGVGNWVAGERIMMYEALTLHLKPRKTRFYIMLESIPSSAVIPSPKVRRPLSINIPQKFASWLSGSTPTTRNSLITGCSSIAGLVLL